MAYKIKTKKAKITKKGYYVEHKNSWASYGLEGVGKKRFDIARQNVKLKDGRVASFFVNRKDNLVVVDIVNKDKKGGVEVYRKKV